MIRYRFVSSITAPSAEAQTMLRKMPEVFVARDQWDIVVDANLGNQRVRQIRRHGSIVRFPAGSEPAA